MSMCQTDIKIPMSRYRCRDTAVKVSMTRSASVVRYRCRNTHVGMPTSRYRCQDTDVEINLSRYRCRDTNVKIAMSRYRCRDTDVEVPMSRYRCRGLDDEIPVSRYRCRDTDAEVSMSRWLMLNWGRAFDIYFSQLGPQADFFILPPRRAAGEDNFSYYLREPPGSSPYHILPPRASRKLNFSHTTSARLPGDLPLSGR